ncbi:unnamed protein product [Ilex paraguariensis]|uniref:Root meristem growth factor 8 n=1 Tax=Ilex paraguariensis TaxID=185542 RepID=A0ABC8U7Q2_9AQUA
MELKIVITTLCIGLSVVLTTCDSHQIQLQSSHEQAHDIQLNLHTLPRKLKLTEKVITNSGDKDLVPYNKRNQVSSVKLHLKEANMKHSRKGTWREWVERTDTSKYFTMDYSYVRRRRPIHNQSLPVGP